MKNEELWTCGASNVYWGDFVGDDVLGVPHIPGTPKNQRFFGAKGVLGVPHIGITSCGTSVAVPVVDVNRAEQARLFAKASDIAYGSDITAFAVAILPTAAILRHSP